MRVGLKAREFCESFVAFGGVGRYLLQEVEMEALDHVAIRLRHEWAPDVWVGLCTRHPALCQMWDTGPVYLTE